MKQKFVPNSRLTITIQAIKCSLLLRGDRSLSASLLIALHLGISYTGSQQRVNEENTRPIGGKNLFFALYLAMTYSSNVHLFINTICQFRHFSIECVVDCATRGRDKCLISTARNAIEGITRQLDTIREYGKLKSFVLVSSKQVHIEILKSLINLLLF